MTDELFRDDATLLQCSATITAAGEAGISLDRTVFYPPGGGQAGDTGRLQRGDGASLAITDTRKGAEPGQILHLVAPGTDLSGWAAGQAVVATVDADRRQAHRRFHTATHLLCALVPFVLSLGPSVLPQLAVVPLTVLWGLAYALPFYIPPGEFAMQIGGKKGTALFTNIFDASGFAASALWNPWASALAKNNDFKTILYSQALFGAISSLTMPLCMYRQMLKEQATKKKE
jgi:hypothetical protein